MLICIERYEVMNMKIARSVCSDSDNICYCTEKYINKLFCRPQRLCDTVYIVPENSKATYNILYSTLSIDMIEPMVNSMLVYSKYGSFKLLWVVTDR